MSKHALHRSKQLRAFAGPEHPEHRRLGFGTRQVGDRLLVAIFPEAGSRFAGYIVDGDALTEHRIIEGIPAAVNFLTFEAAVGQPQQ